MVTIDEEWLAEHPLPDFPIELDKNSRGRVLIVGGSSTVPGGIRLAAEAAFRGGAGKVQLAVPRGLGTGLGIALPECGILPLPLEDGPSRSARATKELLDAAGEADCILLGPAMSHDEGLSTLINELFGVAVPPQTIVIDAIALQALSKSERTAEVAERLVLTPNPDEAAALSERDATEVRRDPVAALQAIIDRYPSTVALKGCETWIGGPRDKAHLRYEGGGPGLATSGSGDVLAGLLAGLLSRGTPATVAAAWAAYLHGEAGRRLFDWHAPLAFLARQLLDEIPQVLRARVEEGRV